MRFSSSMHIGSSALQGGGRPPPPTVLSITPSIGDVSVGNTGVSVLGTVFTDAGGGSLVQSVWFVPAVGAASQATVTGVTKNGGGAGIDKVTVTTPSLTIGNYDIRVVTKGGAATLAGGYDAWGANAAGLEHYWDAAHKLLDVDGKVISNPDQGVGTASLLTWSTRPLWTASDATWNGQASADCTAGAYALSDPFTLAQPFSKIIVGSTGSEADQHFLFTARNSPNFDFTIFYNVGNPSFLWYVSADGSKLIHPQPPPTFGDHFVIGQSYDGAGLASAYINKKTPITNSNADTTGITNGVVLGARPDILGIRHLTGTWCAAGAFSGPVTSVMLRWHGWKYGVTLGA